MSRKVIYCAEPAGQANDFELIPTVRMESLCWLSIRTVGINSKSFAWPAKSQVASFGFGNNCFCDIYLNGCAVAMVDKVKYLGVYVERKSGKCDISQAFTRFYSQFNNIMAVMGKNSNELTSLHLVKTYCLPTLLFGCEIWNLIVIIYLYKKG